MSRFMRLFSGRWNVPHQDQSGNVSQERRRPSLICKVSFLDGTYFNFEVPKKAYGSVLYQKVFNYMDLIETDYFGLQFTDDQQINRWLEVNKQIRKQVFRLDYTGSKGTIPIFRLRVKFYSSQPSNLKEEITRYQVFLQVKQDVLAGRLSCPFETAVELAALVVQSEFGDFDPAVHSQEIISEFRFVPNQTPEMEAAIFEKFKSCKGISPGFAEMTYLNKARWLELYGVDFHIVQGRDGNDYTLGLVPAGVLVFEKLQKIGLFYWPKITELVFKKKKIILEVVESDDKGVDQEHTFIFRCSSERACKNLWKCAVEHHAFFRLSGPSKPVGMKHTFLRMGSRFRYSGNTELQSLTSVGARKSVTFERKPSERMSRHGDSTRQSSNNLNHQGSTRKQQRSKSAVEIAPSHHNNNIDSNNYPNGNHHNHQGGSTTMKRTLSGTANGTLNKTKSSSKRLNSSNDLEESTNNVDQHVQQHKQHHPLPPYQTDYSNPQPQQHQQHNNQQPQQNSLPKKSNLKLSNSISHKQQQHESRPRTKSADSHRVRSHTQIPLTTTTITTTDFSSTTSSLLKKSAHNNNNNKNDTVATLHSPNNTRQHNNSDYSTTATTTNEVLNNNNHNNTSTSKRISDTLKKETSHFNRRGDPRFQSSNNGLSPALYNTNGTLKKPQKSISNSNIVERPPSSDAHTIQRVQFDWSIAPTNHASLAPVNSENPYYYNYKENYNNNSGTTPLHNSFHSSLQKKRKPTPSSGPQSSPQHQQHLSSRTTPDPRSPNKPTFHNATYLCDKRLPLTSSSSHNQHLNHSSNSYSQSPNHLSNGLSPANNYQERPYSSQSGSRGHSQLQRIDHYSGHNIQHHHYQQQQQPKVQPSPYGFNVYNNTGQIIAKQQAQTKPMTKRVVQHRDDRAKSVVILTTEV